VRETQAGNTGGGATGDVVDLTEEILFQPQGHLVGHVAILGSRRPLVVEVVNVLQVGEDLGLFQRHVLGEIDRDLVTHPRRDDIELVDQLCGVNDTSNFGLAVAREGVGEGAIGARVAARAIVRKGVGAGINLVHKCLCKQTFQHSARCCGDVC